MNSASSIDRRKHARHPLPTSVEFHHGPSHRDFPGRCVDLSKGGMLMYVPASTPVQPGDSLRVQLGSMNRPEFAELGAAPVEASIARVNRQSLLDVGYLAVGVRFTV